jgi:N-acetylglutamate synthase-like GNAT family acetyltransferase
VDSPQRIVRRANVDDLPALKLLWQRAHLQVLDLEKHLTEFQLVATPECDLIGAVALHIEGKNGRLHSEAFTRSDQADEARTFLWQRIQNLAHNHGLLRLWTVESSPFWHRAGFVQADTTLLEKLPKTFGDPHARWFTLPLRDDHAHTLSVEKEFELFQLSQRTQTEQVLTQARRLKALAYLLTLVVAAIALTGIFFLLFKANRNQPARAPDQILPAPSP